MTLLPSNIDPRAISTFKNTWESTLSSTCLAPPLPSGINPGAISACQNTKAPPLSSTPLPSGVIPRAIRAKNTHSATWSSAQQTRRLQEPLRDLHSKPLIDRRYTMERLILANGKVIHTKAHRPVNFIVASNPFYGLDPQSPVQFQVSMTPNPLLCTHHTHLIPPVEREGRHDYCSSARHAHTVTCACGYIG